MDRKPSTEKEGEEFTPSRRRLSKAWDYLRLGAVNALIFGIAGYMYAYQYRPLAEQGPVILPIFVICGAGWGAWSAYRWHRR
ncbi:hypothetical protein N6H14_18490 [Paenibacillus sp. CC-CFT747]|nr:hypothetical protein N6H14_18490 [Paenibacillus sp. CC-CFT747]